MTDDEVKALPAYIRPQLRLFFTADIVGSTAYKQRNLKFDEDELELNVQTTSSQSRKKYLYPKWYSPVVELYDQTELELKNFWYKQAKLIEADCESEKSKTKKSFDFDIGLPPIFWKAIGDEVCFTKKVNDPRTVVACVIVWIQTINAVRDLMKVHSPELDIKSAMWVGGFPLVNTQVVFPSKSFESNFSRDNEDSFVLSNLEKLEKYYAWKKNPEKKDESWMRDFVGPAIDTGFRISGLATPRKLVISVELAYLLTDVIKTYFKATKSSANLLSQYQKLEIFYDGRVTLKGVAGGLHYPALWIDLEGFDESADAFYNAEKFFNLDPKTDIEKIRDLSLAYINSNDKFFHLPYIINTQSKKYGVIPNAHSLRYKLLGKIDEWYKNECISLEKRNEDISQSANTTNQSSKNELINLNFKS